MKTMLRTRIFTLVLFGAFLSLPNSVFAQGSESAQVELSQGRAAVILANKLGLSVGQSTPLTPQRAIQLLTAMGISPLNGWDASESLEAGDAARIIAQSFGLDEDFSDEEKEDNSNYNDKLIEQFGLDAEGLIQDNYTQAVDSGPSGSGPATLPSILFASEEDFEEILAALVPSQGFGGQVDDGSSNITPSAP